MNQLLKCFGFRSIVDIEYKSQSEFRTALFKGETKRHEFDKIEFIFDLNVVPPEGFVQID